MDIRLHYLKNILIGSFLVFVAGFNARADLTYVEDDVTVSLLVKTELSRLSESLSAALLQANEGFQA